MAATAASETSEGPVLNLINKRLRALRKKHNRILQMEESLANGKTLNKEQEETFRSKPSVIAAIDELEKLRQPLSAAVTEEINLATAVQPPTAEEISIVEDLLNVIYFGNMFDHVKLGQSELLTRAVHERAACLSYDCMADDENDSMDLLAEKDLDLISMLSGLLISRPVNSTLSHKNALQRCIEHAKLWVSKSAQPIGPECDATYAGLRSKLNKVLSSLYFTTDPVFRVEEPVADYEAYHVPVEETVEAVPVHATMQEDASAMQFHQEKEEEYGSSQADESIEAHGGSVEEFHQQEKLSEQPVEPEQVGHEGGVENLKDENLDDQQYVPRRSYQNYRGNRGGGGGSGGGRRGYSNGRGGRGRGYSYQNDRSPYYDQSGNYYQKNYNNYRGRGGRGSRGGGNYSNYASGGQAGDVAAVS